MKILWLCNMMLPVIAQQFNIEASNKEGWISGLADVLLTHQAENGIELSIAFPLPEGALRAGNALVERELMIEDTNNYMKKIYHGKLIPKQK